MFASLSNVCFINVCIHLSDNDTEGSQPAKYTEIQVNQLTDTTEGFLPPIHTTGMFSVVH